MSAILLIIQHVSKSFTFIENAGGHYKKELHYIFESINQ
jgi:hypothetical protein